jgi:hypothetical protein
MNEANPGPNSKRAETTKRNSTGRWLAFGPPLGVGVGAAMGSATHNMAVWVAFGTAIGVCFGLCLSHINSS